MTWGCNSGVLREQSSGTESLPCLVVAFKNNLSLCIPYFLEEEYLTRMIATLVQPARVFRGQYSDIAHGSKCVSNMLTKHFGPSALCLRFQTQYDTYIVSLSSESISMTN